MNTQLQKSAVYLFALSLYTILSPAYAAEQQGVDAAGAYFDLSDFTLQLPIANQNAGIQEIRGRALDRYASPYFYLDTHDRAMVFVCMSDGATSRDSPYPRTELRDNNEWQFTGQHVISATLAVDQQPSTRDIIVGQIHGDHPGTEALKIRWVNGNIVIGVKQSMNATEVKYTLVKSLTLNQRFSYTIAQSGHTVTVTVNGVSKSFVYDFSWDNQNLYFKVGDYLQDHSLPESIGQVEFFSLKHS